MAPICCSGSGIAWRIWSWVMKPSSRPLARRSSTAAERAAPSGAPLPAPPRRAFAAVGFAEPFFAAARFPVVVLVATGLRPPLTGQCGRRVDCLFELFSFEMQHLELSFEIVD